MGLCYYCEERERESWGSYYCAECKRLQRVLKLYNTDVYEAVENLFLRNKKQQNFKLQNELKKKLNDEIKEHEKKEVEEEKKEYNLRKKKP